MDKNSPKILFNKQALPYVLDIFGKAIDEKEPIKESEFGGIKKGSEIFLKNNLQTIMNLADGKY
jgi:hypothetical protein